MKKIEREKKAELNPSEKNYDKRKEENDKREEKGKLTGKRHREECWVRIIEDFKRDHDAQVKVHGHISFHYKQSCSMQ